MNYYSMKGEDTELDIYDNFEIESNSEIGKWHCSVLSIFKESKKRSKNTCGRQNHDPLKDIHNLIIRTCRYVKFHWKGELQSQMELKLQISLL